MYLSYRTINNKINFYNFSNLNIFTILFRDIPKLTDHLRLSSFFTCNNLSLNSNLTHRIHFNDYSDLLNDEIIYSTPMFSSKTKSMNIMCVN